MACANRVILVGRGIVNAMSGRSSAELGEKCDGGVQVIDDDGDVVHPLNGHVSAIRSRRDARCGKNRRITAGGDPGTMTPARAFVPGGLTIC